MEQIKIIVLALVLSIASPTFADVVVSNDGCPERVQTIKKGDQANCDGFLFSHDAEAEAEQAKLQAEYFGELVDAYKEKSKLQDDENQILEQRLKLYMDSTHSLSQDLAKRDTNEGLYRMLYLGLGVVVAGLAVRTFRP